MRIHVRILIYESLSVGDNDPLTLTREIAAVLSISLDHNLVDPVRIHTANDVFPTRILSVVTLNKRACEYIVRMGASDAGDIRYRPYTLALIHTVVENQQVSTPLESNLYALAPSLTA